MQENPDWMRKLFRHGLVIGKFYPPHLGHLYLIRAAAQHCEHVTVLVLASSAESIPLQQRIDWLQECFAHDPWVRILGEMDDLPVDYADPDIWEGHVAIMRKAAQTPLNNAKAEPVDAVFTSEPYGAELAQRLNAANVCLDQARNLYPISGTAARLDAAQFWLMLPAPVRRDLAMRIVILGAESTGTTTLARDLTRALQKRGSIWAHTQCVAEYGREFSATLQAVTRAIGGATAPSHLDWDEQHFIDIAQEQTRLENQAAAQGSPILICDTDALATCLWHERYLGQRSSSLEEQAKALAPRALYILTSEEGVPFENDGLRDGEHLRVTMSERFRQALSEQNTPWVEVHGTSAERLEKALWIIDEMRQEHWNFTPPLPEANVGKNSREK